MLRFLSHLVFDGVLPCPGLGKFSAEACYDHVVDVFGVCLLRFPAPFHVLYPPCTTPSLCNTGACLQAWEVVWPHQLLQLQRFRLVQVANKHCECCRMTP